MWLSQCQPFAQTIGRSPTRYPWQGRRRCDRLRFRRGRRQYWLWRSILAGRASNAARRPAGKIHQALTGDMVRSKSEAIIANLLHERDIEFRYEKSLYVSDGTMYLPDFTLT